MSTAAHIQRRDQGTKHGDDVARFIRHNRKSVEVEFGKERRMRQEIVKRSPGKRSAARQIHARQLRRRTKNIRSRSCNEKRLHNGRKRRGRQNCPPRQIERLDKGPGSACNLEEQRLWYVWELAEIEVSPKLAVEDQFAP